MANLEKLRLKYPQFKDLDDTALANAIHQRFYSGVDKATVFEKLGLPAPKEEPRTTQAPAMPAPSAQSPALPMIDFSTDEKMPAFPEQTKPILGAVSGIIDMIAPQSPAAKVLGDANALLSPQAPVDAPPQVAPAINPGAAPALAPGPSILDAIALNSGSTPPVPPGQSNVLAQGSAQDPATLAPQQLPVLPIPQQAPASPIPQQAPPPPFDRDALLAKRGELFTQWRLSIADNDPQKESELHEQLTQIDAQLKAARESATAAKVKPAEESEDPTEGPDPFDGEGFADLSKRRGQEVVQGASGVIQSIARARGINDEILAAAIKREAPKFVQEAARQIESFEKILARGMSDSGKGPMTDQEREVYQSRLDAAELALKNWTRVAKVGHPHLGNLSPKAERQAKAIRDWTDETFGVPPEDDSIWSELSYGTGSMIGFALPAVVAGPAGAVVSAKVGADVSKVEAYDRAIAAGATEAQARTAAYIAGPLGTLEAVPIASALKKLPEPVRKDVMGRIGRFLVQSGKGATEEALQEAFAAVGQNLIAKGIYNPEQQVITKDVGDQAIVGAILGAFIGGGANVTGLNREKDEDVAVSGDRPPAPERGETMPRLSVPPLENFRPALGRDIDVQTRDDLDPLKTQSPIAPTQNNPDRAPFADTDPGLPPRPKIADMLQLTPEDRVDLPAPVAEPPAAQSDRYEIIDEIDVYDDGTEYITGRKLRLDLETGQVTPLVGNESGGALPDSGAGADPEGVPGGARPVEDRSPALPDMLQLTPEDRVDPQIDPATSPLFQPQGRINEGQEPPSTPPVSERPIPDDYESPPRPVEASLDNSTPGQPVRKFLTNAETLAIETDADVFQYKDGGDETGVTDRLRGVENFDPDRSGRAILYRDESGRVIVADGHQRVGLAKRAAEAGQADVGGMAATIYDAKDGYSPQDVMVIAALKNIGEGSGTALDAARILRERNETIADLGLPPQSVLVRQAEGLRRLSDDAFGLVANGIGSERNGAVVGMQVSDPDAHVSILDLLTKLERSKSLTQAQAEIVARDAAADTRAATQDDLFGSDPATDTLYLERAKVLDAAQSRLKAKKGLFNRILRDAGDIEAAGNQLNKDANKAEADQSAVMLEYLKRQANTKGPISDALSKAAKAVKDGSSLASAADEFVADVERAIQGDGETGPARGEGRTPPESSTQAASDPETEVTPEGEQFVIPGAEQDQRRSDDARKADQKREIDARINSRLGSKEGQAGAGPLFGNEGGDTGDLFGGPAADPEPGPEPAPKSTVGTYVDRSGGKFDNSIFQSRVDELPDQMDPENLGQEARDLVVKEGERRDLEHIIAFDGEGQIIAYGSGTKSSTGFPAALSNLKDDADADIAIHHNHPSSNAFSAADYAITLKSGFRVTYAHTHDGVSLRAEPTPLGRALLERLGDSLQSKIHNIFNNTWAKSRPGIIKLGDQGVYELTDGALEPGRDQSFAMMRAMNEAGLFKTEIVVATDARPTDDSKNPYFTDPDLNKVYKSMVSSLKAMTTRAKAKEAVSDRPTHVERHPGDMEIVPDRDGVSDHQGNRPRNQSDVSNRDPQRESGDQAQDTGRNALDAAEDELFGAEPKPKASAEPNALDAAEDELFGAESKVEKPKPTRVDDASALNNLFGEQSIGFRENTKSFNDERYQQAIPIFSRNVEGMNLDEMSDKDAYVSMARPLVDAGMTRDAFRNMRPYFERFLSDVRSGKIDLQGDQDARSPSRGLEPDRGDAGSTDPVGSAGVSNAPRPDEQSDRARDGGPVKGNVPQAGTRVSGGDAAPVGSGSDSKRQGLGPLDDGRRDGDGDGADGRNRSEPGLRPDDAGPDATRKDASDSPDVKAAEPKDQPSEHHKAVAKSVPALRPEQVDDVVRIERRFFEPEKGKESGFGMLITNGTGTGKTMTALGTAKRFVDKGMKSVLAIVKTQGEVNNWIDHGPLVDLKVDALRGTSDNGDGRAPVIVTTYANLANNRTLADREWDLVISDESHMLSMNKTGEQTEALNTLRAIANKPSHLAVKERMKMRKEIDAAKEIKSQDVRSERLRALYQEAHDKAKKNKSKRSNVLFLSATPFAYDRNVDYGEGYLFDYPKDETRNGSRQSGQNWFMVENFGYRIRYHKLNKPEAAVDQGVFHREFHERLKREGSLWGRKLDVASDYDRKFVASENDLGSKIDQALKYISDQGSAARKSAMDIAAKQGGGELSAANANARSKALGDSKVWENIEKSVRKNFSYLKRMQLLEAMKAEIAIPDIQAHLDMGRKVVVFHDYNKGGATSPFAVTGLDADGKAALQKMNQDLPWLKDLKFGHLPPPKQQILAAFGDRAREYNGTVSKKERQAAKDAFNADDSGVDVIVVQSDAGSGGISLHDTTGQHQRVLINLGMPTKPTTTLQAEGRTRRVGVVSNAPYRYYTIGTAWERQAFASRIAEGSGAVENLALGNEARAIREAFVTAYEGATPLKPSANDGIGGREADLNNNNTSEFDRAKSHYFARAKQRGRRDQREGIDFFPTPEPLGLKMVEWAGIRTYEKVLEPSAGDGSIARYFPQDSDRTIVEPSSDLSSRAELRTPGARVVNSRFEDLAVVNKYDAVVMNPPFGRGGKTAYEHVEKALMHTRLGGRVVALVPTGPAADKQKDKMFERLGKAAEEWNLTGVVHLPAVTFERAGTNVSAVVLIMDRVGKDSGIESSQRINMTASQKIGDFFDRLEGIAGPSRPEAAGPPGVEVDLLGGDDLATQPAISDPVMGEPVIKFEVFEFEHSKTGEKMFGAKVKENLDRDRYLAVAALAKTHNGYYNKFQSAKTGAKRGFVFKTDADRRAFMEDLGKPSQDEGFDERLYHGSHQRFDRFSQSKIGTGEGAQAFGWGLYFAESKDVAEHYRKQVLKSSASITVDGKNISAGNKKMADKTAKQRAVTMVHSALSDGHEVYVAEMKSRNAVRRAEQGDLTAFQREGGWGEVDTLREAHEIIKSWMDSDVSLGKGMLATVDVPDKSEFMVWEKPLSEQSDVVQAALLDMHWAPDKSVWSETTGQDLYEQLLIEEMGDDAFVLSGRQRSLARSEKQENVSLILKRAGIPGHRFLDEHSRQAGSGTYNYVVYDDSQIEIVAKEHRPLSASGSAMDFDALSRMFPRLRAELDRMNLKRVNLGLDAPGAGRQGVMVSKGLGQIDILIGASLDPEKTLYHETIHALKAMNVFTPKEWATLKAAALNGWIDKHDIQKRYPDLIPSEQIEEAIAEEFSEAAKSRVAPKGVMVSAFNKIARFMKAVRNAIKGNGMNSVEDIFDKVLAGEIGARNAGNTGALVALREQAQPLPRLPSASTGGQVKTTLPVHIPDRRIWDELTNSNASFFGRIGGAGGAIYDYVDKARFIVQDRMLPVLRAQEAIEIATGKPIPADLRPYQTEVTYSGKAGRHLEEIDDGFTKPIIHIIAKSKGVLTAQNVGDWLAARHAKERNAQIASINPAMPDGGSGITNAEADAYLAMMAATPVAKELNQIGKLVDDLRDRTMKVRLDAGLLSPEQYHLWKNQYRHYVPLKGFEESDGAESMAPTQRSVRYNTRGPESRRALGRGDGNLSFNPLVAALTQAQEVSVRAEKNRVGQALYELAKAHPSEMLWEIKKPKNKRFYNRSTGLVETRLDPAVSYQMEPNEFAVKVDGVEHRVVLNDPRIAAAMNNMGADATSALVRVVGAYNRYQSAILTMLSPEFVVRNAFRDIQTALINLPEMTKNDIDIKGFRREVSKNWFKAFTGVRRGMTGKVDSEWTRYNEEFEKAGGKISFWTLDNPVAGAADIDKRISLARGPKAARLLKTLTRPSAFFNTRDNALLGTIERWNLAVDNAIRLSTFVAARKRGMSEQNAANLSKNLTVNFNRRGQAVWLNSVFLFFNAATQGMQTFARVMFSKYGASIGAGLLTYGVLEDLMNAWLSEEDDDGELAYDKIPEYQSQRNFMFMAFDGGGEKWGKGGMDDAAKVPMPYVYSVPVYAGRQIGKVLRGVKTADEALIDVFLGAASDVSPVGFTEPVDMITPTILSDMIEFRDNENWLDRPIRPEYDMSDYGVMANKYYVGVSEFSRVSADLLNRVTGGNSAVSGLIDISPEYIDHAIGTATGSAGTFWFDAFDSGVKVLQGNADIIEGPKIPFLSEVYMPTGPWLDRSNFYERHQIIKDASARVGDAKDSLELAKPEHYLLNEAKKKSNALMKAVAAINKDRMKVRLDQNLSVREKALAYRDLEKQAQPHYDELNRIYTEIRKEIPQIKDDSGFWQARMGYTRKANSVRDAVSRVADANETNSKVALKYLALSSLTEALGQKDKEIAKLHDERIAARINPDLNSQQLAQTLDEISTRAIPLYEDIIGMVAEMEHGIVTSVTDGDTFRSGELRVRVSGINAPELRDPGGKASKEALARLIEGRPLMCEDKGKDTFGRQLAKCQIESGEDIATFMLRIGQAVPY
jgi:endonuclease YncB( thermonuclease family)/ATP:corrinoid adenosyltransferase